MLGIKDKVKYRGRAYLGKTKVNITKGDWEIIARSQNGNVKLKSARGLVVIVKNHDFRKVVTL
jgi:hypothetical protein